MLKFIFWFLLCLNAALFAFGRGYLGNFQPSEREPARIANQLNTDRLVLLTTSAAAKRAVPMPAPEAAAPVATPEPAAVMVACTEIGAFTTVEARRFDKLVAKLDLAEHESKLEVPSTEISSHLVMIPPMGSKEAADKKAAQLKGLGVSNYFIMNDTTAFKWAISLGVFKSEAAAQTLLAALEKQGVSGVKIVGRPSSKPRMAYRFRDIDAAAKARLAGIADKFDAIETHTCK